MFHYHLSDMKYLKCQRRLIKYLLFVEYQICFLFVKIFSTEINNAVLTALPFAFSMISFDLKNGTPLFTYSFRKILLLEVISQTSPNFSPPTP